MRQAGRYMKEYRQLRQKVSFLELCKNPDLVTQVTVEAQEKIKADAAIIFADILLMAEAMGLGLEYLKTDGPSIRALQNSKDVENLAEVEPEDSLSFVLKAVRQTRKALKPDIALIGFAGAPFTLASYMIEGGSSRDFKKTKTWMRENTPSWHRLMEKLVRATAKYLNAQVKAGADAVQIFDSWVGNLTADEYGAFVFPHSKTLVENLDKKAPVIHFGTGTGHFLESFSQAGGDVISVDHRVKLTEAWERIGPSKAIQGNLDPLILCEDLKTIEKEVKAILDSVKGRPGHIFNLGHGVLPQTPVENVIALVEMVHGYR
jgi:uroporphyrinogen decarboxylase